MRAEPWSSTAPMLSTRALAVVPASTSDSERVARRGNSGLKEPPRPGRLRQAGFSRGVDNAMLQSAYKWPVVGRRPRASVGYQCGVCTVHPGRALL